MKLLVLYQPIFKETRKLRVVTIAINHPPELHFENFNIFGDLYITQSNIYDGAFNAKIVSRCVYSQKGSIVDTRFGSKYASAF